MSQYNEYIDISTIKKGTKILFANVPADGHFNPLTGLAVHLKNMGCDVRWYTSETYAEKIERLGIPFYGLKKAMDISAATEDMEKTFPERAKHKSQISKLKFDLINVFILRGPEYYEDIQDIYMEFPFEVMIADITFGAIPFVKEKMNIPVINVSVIPLPETSKDLAPSGLGITPASSFLGKIKQNVLRFIADIFIFAGPTKVMRKILLSYGINPGKANIFDIHIQKSSVVLQSGTPGFEYRRSDLSRHIYFAGALLPNRKKQGPRWYSEKLKQFETVLLVTQGTVEKDVNKLLVPTLEAFKNSNCLVIATTGGSGTEELREKYPFSNIIIEDFIPFDDVMPYADVYISNGGYGGVLLGIQNGLPLVVAGVHEGKNEINARVGYFELGINLKTEKPGVLQIRKSVEEILANETYTKNVTRLKEEFSKYNPGEICARQVARLLQKNSHHRVTRQQEEYSIY